MLANDLHISSLDGLDQDEVQAILSTLTDDECKALLYDWSFLARPEQLLPAGNDFTTWFIMAGRGWGKTRTGAEGIKELERRGYRRFAFTGRTAADVRDVMVEGESGILSVYPPDERPKYEPSKRRITFKSGAVATTFSADKPDQLRGPQHDAAWSDELAAWRYPETWDQLQFGLRLGTHPINIVTSTPRPTKLVRDIIRDKTTLVTKGRTLDNAANLAPPALKRLLDKYGGTRLGRQELNGDLLTDVPGALWTLKLIDDTRVRVIPQMKRVVVAIDPAVTATEESDETGIVICGLGADGHGYLLDDLTLSGSPDEWAKAAIAAYVRFEADAIIAETNNGGDIVESVIRLTANNLRQGNVPVRQVKASRGKLTRAEPISMLYEQHKIHHVGVFSELEDQMCTWVQGESDSPDRMDAAVWGFSELMLKSHFINNPDLNPAFNARDW